MNITIKGLIPSAYQRITKDLCPSRWCKSAAEDHEGFWDVILDESVVLKVYCDELWINSYGAMTDLEASEFVEVEII